MTDHWLIADSIAERDAIAAWCAGAMAARRGRLDVVRDGLRFDFYGPDAAAACWACHRLIAALYADGPTGPGGEA